MELVPDDPAGGLLLEQCIVWAIRHMQKSGGSLALLLIRPSYCVQQFLPSAQYLGALLPMEARALRQAAVNFAPWRSQVAAGVHLDINISVALLDSGLAQGQGTLFYPPLPAMVIPNLGN